MSERAVNALETKFDESSVYADLIAPHLSPNDRILDIGSGVGLPGILLALRFPTTPLTLVERRHKRASFLTLVVGQLGLKQVRVVRSDVRALRIESQPTHLPATWITAQAVGHFALLYQLSSHLFSSSLDGGSTTLVARRESEATAELSADLAETSRLAGFPYEILSLPLPTHGRVLGLRFEL